MHISIALVLKGILVSLHTYAHHHDEDEGPSLSCPSIPLSRALAPPVPLAWLVGLHSRICRQLRWLLAVWACDVRPWANAVAAKSALWH